MPRRRGGRRKGRKPRRRKVRRLPNDVLTDIFHKLPCNSMVRSKLVCKEWYSIISNPDFMQEYFKRIGKHFIFFEFVSYREFNIYDVNCSNLINNNDTAILSSIPPLEDPRKWGCKDENLEIIGSCNGLVALANGNNLILWNPITKHYKSFSGKYWFFEPRWEWNFNPRILRGTLL
ncbi:F-box protein CPR30-like [Chenopodium quinoa]|uniref:F-box protein CPR30-like n=1 Tax=Chenopodium quinoa TaxID=63459 RepID=UPI000B7742CB|nr:F-box protein CPR30-like [Chenopodium quinoa]